MYEHQKYSYTKAQHIRISLTERSPMYPRPPGTLGVSTTNHRHMHNLKSAATGHNTLARFKTYLQEKLSLQSSVCGVECRRARERAGVSGTLCTPSGFTGVWWEE